MCKQLFGYANYLIIIIVAILFILIFSDVASPLTEDYSADSSIFMAMGKMFLNGKVPYVEFFDHKGPSLIVLQALGQSIISGRLGMFFLEIVNLSFTLLLVYRICRLKLSPASSLAICFVTIFILSRFFNRGNTTEELSLFPLFITLYYTAKSFFEKKGINSKVGIIIGLCFSFLFWLRINNAGVIVACCIFLFIYYLCNKDYKSVKYLVFYFFIGQLPLTLLYFAYFIYHNGLYDMIYATFLFNFLYVGELINFASEHNWMNYLLGATLVFGAALYYYKYKDWFVFLFSFLLLFFTMITTNIGPAYNHYYILTIPALVFGLVLILDVFKQKGTKMTVLFLSTILLINTLYKGYLHHQAVSPQAIEDYNTVRKNATNLFSLIPDSEKEELYIYNVGSSIYPLMGIDSNYKYFVFQERHGEIDLKIFEEINEMMLSKKPKWILLQTYETMDKTLDEYANTQFADIIRSNYHLADQQGFHALYKLN